MKRSKAGQKLNPIIAKETEPIYRRDPKRYERLIIWVWHNQRIGWPDEAIANALRMADAYLDVAPNWWAYLTKVLPKAKAAAHEQESNEFKQGDLNSFKSIMKEIVAGLGGTTAPEVSRVVDNGPTERGVGLEAAAPSRQAGEKNCLSKKR